MTTVLITADFPDALIEKCQAVSNQLNVRKVLVKDDNWPEEATQQAEIIYTYSKLPELHMAQNLRWVQLHSAGSNHLMDKPVWESDIILTSASGIHAIQIGQYVIAQMLAWSNKIPTWVAHQKNGRWPKNRWNTFLPTELKGQTVGILGYGSIGREVARLCKAFNMKVLATKRDVKHPTDSGFIIHGTGDPNGDLPDRLYPPQAMKSMVALCDFVVVTLPMTAETDKIVDEAVLREMKENCYLINIGRGGVIDEKALAKALRKGWIAGAGLDVFTEEPLPDDSPFWQMENVILTPHISGFTPAYDARVTDLFAENLRRYLSGEPLLNVIDRERGY